MTRASRVALAVAGIGGLAATAHTVLLRHRCLTWGRPRRR